MSPDAFRQIRVKYYLGWQDCIFWLFNTRPLPTFVKQNNLQDLRDQSEAGDSQKHAEASADRRNNCIDIVKVKLLGDDLQVGRVGHVSDPLVGHILTYELVGSKGVFSQGKRPPNDSIKTSAKHYDA